jgi:hypothetical protein
MNAQKKINHKKHDQSDSFQFPGIKEIKPMEDTIIFPIIIFLAIVMGSFFLNLPKMIALLFSVLAVLSSQ